MNKIQSSGNAGRWHWTSSVSAAVVVFLVSLLGVGLYQLGREVTSSIAQASEIPSVTFEGETFGRTLSGDVERKKLDKPLGVFDEIMLQSCGDPQLRLRHIYAYKHLGDATSDVKRVLTDVCAELEARYGVEMRRTARASCREAWADADRMYMSVSLHTGFFPDERLLVLHVGCSGALRPLPDVVIGEVLGEKFGCPPFGRRAPKKALWKFEEVEGFCQEGEDIVDGIDAVCSVSNLTLRASVEQYEEAKRAVEAAYGLTLSKDIDYDVYKRCTFEGANVTVRLRLLYWGGREIVLTVETKGDCREQIHGRVPTTHRLIFLTCLCVVMLGLVFLALRRTPKEAFFKGWRLYAVMSGTSDRAEYVLFGRVCNLVSYALFVVALLPFVMYMYGQAMTRPVSLRMMAFSFWALTGCAWLVYGYWIALIPMAIAMWIRHRRAKKLGVEGALEFSEPSRCPPFFASPVFRGALGIVAFFCGVAVCYVLQGGRIDDPIVGCSIPFLGLYTSFVFGLTCAMTAFALNRGGLPKGIFANVLGVLALLLIAFLIHLENAFVHCGHDFTLASAGGGFLARLAPFAVLLLCAWMLLGVFLYVLHCFPIVRGVLANSGQTARTYVARLAALTAWVCLLSFVVYELLILVAFTICGRWAG